jgi:hypothetical protein
MANEKRLRIGGLAGTVLNNPLAIGGTSLTVDHDTRLEAITSANHLAIVLDPAGTAGAPEVVYATAYDNSDPYVLTIARAQEGTTAREHATATVWQHGPTVRDIASGRVAFARRSSGDITASSTSWADVHADFQLSVPAADGDIVEVGVSTSASGSGTRNISMDASSFVSGSPVISWGRDAAEDSGFQGIMAWRLNAGVFSRAGGGVMRRVTAAEIVAGVLTIHLRYKVDGGSGDRTIFAGTNAPSHFHVTNHGPQAA